MIKLSLPVTCASAIFLITQLASAATVYITRDKLKATSTVTNDGVGPSNSYNGRSFLGTSHPISLVLLSTVYWPYGDDINSYSASASIQPLAPTGFLGNAAVFPLGSSTEGAGDIFASASVQVELNFYVVGSGGSFSMDFWTESSTLVGGGTLTDLTNGDIFQGHVPPEVSLIDGHQYSLLAGTSTTRTNANGDPYAKWFIAFDSDVVSSVPEGGSTLVMLGIAVMGSIFFRAQIVLGKRT